MFNVLILSTAPSHRDDRATTNHAYDEPVRLFLGKDDAHLQAACERAGLVLLRDVAMPTKDELVEKCGFSIDEAREVNKRLTSRYIMHGEELQGMVQLYLRDLDGGEGNERRARKQLIKFGVDISRTRRRR